MKPFGGIGRRRAARGALLVASLLTSVTVLTLGACRKSAPPTPVVKLTPVPARPSEVIAELTLPAPLQLWPRLRALAGPLGDIMPSGPELALAGVASVPPLAAGAFDLHSPIALVWLGGDAPGFVLGAHLESGPELIAQVASGTHPTHRVERRGEIAYLSHVSGAGFAFAVVSDTLLLGPERAVERAGEYVARALRPRAPHEGPIVVDFVGPALKSSLVPALSAAWAKRRAALVEALGREQSRQGRPADLADPAALLSALDGFAQEVLAVVGSVKTAHGEVATAGEGVALSLRIEAEPEGAARSRLESLRPGRADRFWELPSGAALAVFHRREHSATAGDLVRALFASRLAPSEAKSLDRALEQLRAGRGDAEAFALTPDFGLVWRGDVTDPTELRGALTALLPLLARPPFADALGATIGRPSLTHRPVERRGDDTLDRSLIRLSPKTGGAAPVKSFELSSLIGPRRFLFTLEKAGSTAFEAALAAESSREGALAAAPAFAPLLSATGDVAWLAAADLSKLGLAAADARATVSASESVDAGALTMTVRASDGALRALTAREFGR